jgi:hypothetical protein
MMAQQGVLWWQKYGTLAQMAQAAVALLGFVAILSGRLASRRRTAS